MTPPRNSAEKRKGLYLRLPESLRVELAKRAGEQGVSLNSLLLALLAGAVGFNLED